MKWRTCSWFLLDASCLFSSDNTPSNPQQPQNKQANIDYSLFYDKHQRTDRSIFHALFIFSFSFHAPNF